MVLSLQQLHFLSANRALDQGLLFEDSRAFRRAQILALHQPAEYYDEEWETWFLPYRTDSRVFYADEVLHSNLLTVLPDSATEEVGHAPSISKVL